MKLSEDMRLMHAHDVTGILVKSSARTHIVKEQFVPAEHRDIASSNANIKFNIATDEENIDFNIPGVPNSMVLRSHGVNVHNLIQKVENHPQRQVLQSDLQQHRAFNPFSKESNGKKEGDKEFHTANQLKKKCRKRGYKNIHDRFIRDTRFRKSMLETDRTEEVIREMARLANEDHTHIATEEEVDVYRGNWSIRSNFVGSDTMPIRHRPDFKKALSTLHRLKNAEDQAYYQNWSQSSSSSWWQWQDSWWHPSSETSPRRWT